MRPGPLLLAASVFVVGCAPAGSPRGAHPTIPARGPSVLTPDGREVTITGAVFERARGTARFDVSIDGLRHDMSLEVRRGADAYAVTVAIDAPDGRRFAVRTRYGPHRVTVTEWTADDRLDIELHLENGAIARETYRHRERELSLDVGTSDAELRAGQAFLAWFPPDTDLLDNPLGEALVVLSTSEAFAGWMAESMHATPSRQSRLPRWLRIACGVAKICSTTKCLTPNPVCFGCLSATIHCVLFEMF